MGVGPEAVLRALCGCRAIGVAEGPVWVCRGHRCSSGSCVGVGAIGVAQGPVCV